MMDWDVVPLDNNIGLESLAENDIALHDDWSVVLSDNNTGVEILVDIDIAPHDVLECGATG